ncbi:hypothetical protein HNQ81_001862 [Desulfoprunum benzoelyticum]|uniref:Uncharacterized protein n=1 Tax=Desulfoprunum benzoelyticum TaxID=1506996 RepID=A0A840V4W9_9BACT|nr:hypothetical protein [Desulfoprunum benzoelyticum]
MSPIFIKSVAYPGKSWYRNPVSFHFDGYQQNTGEKEPLCRLGKSLLSCLHATRISPFIEIDS